MALTPSAMIPLDTKAPEFDLPDVVSGKNIHIDEVKGENGLLVLFICKHCPYVIHVQQELTKLANSYLDKGVGVAAISSNDAASYPADAPDQLALQARRLGFRFPYLYDESQSVAKAYGAECTPDFFLFDHNLKCVYRGRMDDSTPGNGRPVTGNELRSALEGLINGQPPLQHQFPSMGCNIKWRQVA